MGAWTRWAVIVGASVAAWVPSLFWVVPRLGEMDVAEIESPAKALFALGVLVQAGSILWAAYLVTGLEWRDERTCLMRARATIWIAFACSLPLGWMLTITAGLWLTWVKVLTSGVETPLVQVMEVLGLWVMPAAFIVMSLVLALLPLRLRRARDILGLTLAVSGLVVAAACIGQPGPIGFATAYALAVTVSLATSASTSNQATAATFGLVS